MMRAAEDLIRYTQTYHDYILTQITSHQNAMEALTSDNPTDVPGKGGSELLWAGTLIRAEVVDCEVNPVLNSKFTRSLIPAEPMILIYSVLIFQG